MVLIPITPEQCAGKIDAAKRIAVLSGAGMSTAAGVPDFRGPKGLYATRAYDPETVFEINHFDRDPRPFYAFSRDFLGILASIQPTCTHRFLARLENAGKDIGVITQNIDGLHQRAGSTQVLPFHGDYESAHCRRCNHSYDGGELRLMMEENEIPVCRDCGGVVKPDIVFFGESVRHLAASEKLAADSDLMLVLGSSLAVYPAAAIPSFAGGEVVIVNLGEVGARREADVYFADADLDQFFRGVTDSLAIPEHHTCQK